MGLRGKAASDWLHDTVARAQDRIDMCERFGAAPDPKDVEIVRQAKEQAK